ncbi:MAG: DUF6261 family protein [Parabacteroides sp.]|nr:DUF6261 family protein [Parabacteroides sp.]
MRKIQTFNFSPLHVEEVFGLLKTIYQEAIALRASSGGGSDSPSEITDTINPLLDAKITALEKMLNAFDEALKASSSLPSSATALAADAERDSAWRGINGYVKAMMDHPDATTAANAAEARRLFEKYGDPTSLGQTEESGTLHNLIQDLKALEAGKRESLSLAPWLTSLEAKEEAFLAEAQKRTDEKSKQMVGIVKETRLNAEKAYKEVANTVNALCLLEGDTSYAVFIDHLNVLLDERRTILKARATNNAKKKAAEDEKANGAE